jgi:ribose transport system permease protein
MAVLIGLYHGFMVTRLNMAPFIVTLGSLSMLRGAAFVLSRGYPILVADERFRWLGQGLIGPFPVPLVILIVVAALTWFVLRYTILGRYIYAIGGNPEASRMSGVPVRWVLILVYTQASVLAGIVGLIVAGRMAEGLASVAVGYELTAIASAVIGGTSFLGGIGSIPGTVLGGLLMGMIDNAMITLRVDPYWYNLVTGTIIILAVTIDVLRSRSQVS